MDKPLSRTARLLDLIPFILAHQGIAIGDLAKEFKVTEKEIFADLNLIFMCGLPQYTPLELIDLSFENGFVTVREPQNLNLPRKLSGEELSILIMGLDVIRTQIDDDSKKGIVQDLQAQLQNLMEKSTAVPSLYSDDRSLPFIDLIAEAIRQRKFLLISYLNTSKDSITSRKIIPLEIVQQGEEFLLFTWCFKSKANRTFAISRILTCESTTIDSYEDPPNNLVAELPASAVEVITFKYDRTSLTFVENIKERLTELDDAEMTATLEVWDNEWIIRNVMANAGHISVLKPALLKQEIINRSRIALSNY